MVMFFIDASIVAVHMDPNLGLYDLHKISYYPKPTTVDGR